MLIFLTNFNIILTFFRKPENREQFKINGRTHLLSHYECNRLTTKNTLRFERSTKKSASHAFYRSDFDCWCNVRNVSKYIFTTLF